MRNHTDLWNNLPADERKRLMPHQIERQILHIKQCRQIAIDAHERHIKELDGWMKNLKQDLDRAIK